MAFPPLGMKKESGDGSFLEARRGTVLVARINSSPIPDDGSISCAVLPAAVSTAANFTCRPGKLSQGKASSPSRVSRAAMIIN